MRCLQFIVSQIKPGLELPQSLTNLSSLFIIDLGDGAWSLAISPIDLVDITSSQIVIMLSSSRSRGRHVDVLKSRVEEKVEKPRLQF